MDYGPPSPDISRVPTASSQVLLVDGVILRFAILDVFQHACGRKPQNALPQKHLGRLATKQVKYPG